MTILPALMSAMISLIGASALTMCFLFPAGRPPQDGGVDGPARFADLCGAGVHHPETR